MQIAVDDSGCTNPTLERAESAELLLPQGERTSRGCGIST
jgi:hypothetical protein